MARFLIVLGSLVLFSRVYAIEHYGVYVNVAGGWARQLGLPAENHADLTYGSLLNAYRVAIGYNHTFYRWPNVGFGFEVGGGDYGGARYSSLDGDTRVKSQNMEFLMVFSWFDDPWVSQLRAGGVRQTVDIKGRYSENTDTPMALQLGLAVGRWMTPHWRAGLQVNYVFGKNVGQLRDLGGHSNNPSLLQSLASVSYLF